MDTPLADFVEKYRESGTGRLHMPGHKGKLMLGCEDLDITEIKGADALYEADGIIAASEKNAAALFGTQRTLYSTEGSSQCIRAMLYLAAKRGGSKTPVILAARNVHKSFVYAAALIDFDVEWLWPEETSSICSCPITKEGLEKRLKEMPAAPAAVYITSPDYLGGVADIKALAEVCHAYGTCLLVDNAHGAYTRFLMESLHPMDLGADMCCDSAHKTLPVLTGGAYLHIGKNAPAEFSDDAKQAMALFGSTSPSYLIMQSLDLCNRYLSDGYRQRLYDTVKFLSGVKTRLEKNGWDVVDTDPLKIVIRGDGVKLADKLRENGVECEFADVDYLVMMVTPENPSEDVEKVVEILGKCPARSQETVLPIVKSEKRMTVREALFSKHEEIDVDASCGRICGAPLVSCPPAVPIVITGEVITEEAIQVFKKYGIEKVDVVASIKWR